MSIKDFSQKNAVTIFWASIILLILLVISIGCNIRDGRTIKLYKANTESCMHNKMMGSGHGNMQGGGQMQGGGMMQGGVGGNMQGDMGGNMQSGDNMPGGNMPGSQGGMPAETMPADATQY